VAVVVRPLDRALALFRITLIPLVALTASLATLQTLSRDFATSRHWLIALVLVAAVYVALLQTETVGGRADRLIAHMRRRVAMACNHDDGRNHHDGRVACWLTPDVLRAPVFRYRQQHEAVSTLTKACASTDPGQFWFVEGDSGSGKTRTALLFVQALVRDRKLFELGSRCYLYDFADSDSAQDELVRRLGKRRHDGAVVLVDNFQVVRAETLSKITDCLVDRAGTANERLLVFLTRPGHAWNLAPGADVRLLSEAKAANRHLELRGPSSEAIARSVSDFDPPASRLVRDLQDESVASAAQLHLAQVIARNREVPPEILTILRLLGNERDEHAPAPLVHVLATITALSMHRGTFSPRDARRAIRIAARQVAPRSRLAHALRMRASFRRLHKLGLVPRMQMDGARFIFHEAIAELCVDRLSDLNSFWLVFAGVGRARLEDLRARDPLISWLVAAEIGDQEVLRNEFDAALARGSYSRMTRCLSRARDRYDLEEPACLQLAILLNRVGEFAASKAEFTDDLLSVLDSSDDLGAMLATSYLEATHDEAAERSVAVLRTSSDRLLALVGEYWKIHMDAHRGRFDSQRLLDLATEALELVRSHDGYWATYSLARMHFDSLRHHYLSGGSPASTVVSRERRDVDDYLRDRLPIYEAMHILYTKAHVVGHVLLPRLALYGEPVTPDDADLAELGSDETKSIEALAAATHRLYRRAADEFWQYGDREALYLQADILNAEMVQPGADLDAVVPQLESYHRFLGEADFASLASYPHFYSFRWNALKHYDALLRSERPQPAAADEHLRRAKHHLAEIARLDSIAGNEYGLLRVQLLSVLLNGTKKRLDGDELASLGETMDDRGYAFETDLLRRLRSKGALTPEELRRVLCFYPFVQQ
jgi:hypothetical protein